MLEPLSTERGEFFKAARLGCLGYFFGSLLFAAGPMSAAEPSRPAAEVINTLGIELLAKAAQPGENTAISPYSIQEKPVEVRVDRPFLLVIQHRPSGACLFLGRITNLR